MASYLFYKIGLLNTARTIFLFVTQADYKLILSNSLCSNKLLSVFLSKASTPGDLSRGGGHQGSLC